MEDQYANLKPLRGEDRYVDFDADFDCWGVFGADSGFCYGQYSSEKAAEEAL